LKRVFIHFLLKLLNYLGRFNHAIYMVLVIPLLKLAGMKINGTPRFIAPSATFDDLSRISLGHRIIISRDVKFIVHDYSYTTVLLAKKEYIGKDIARMGRIVIGNNVFVGMGAIILPGTIVGDNVIIGAGSVVRGEIDSGQVLLGNPAVPVTSIDDLYEKYFNDKDSLDLRIDSY